MMTTSRNCDHYIESVSSQVDRLLLRAEEADSAADTRKICLLGAEQVLEELRRYLVEHHLGGGSPTFSDVYLSRLTRLANLMEATR